MAAQTILQGSMVDAERDDARAERDRSIALLIEWADCTRVHTLAETTDLMRRTSEFLQPLRRQWTIV